VVCLLYGATLWSVQLLGGLQGCIVLSVVPVQSCAGFPAHTYPSSTGAQLRSCWRYQSMVLQGAPWGWEGVVCWWTWMRAFVVCFWTATSCLPCVHWHGSISLHAWFVSSACALMGRATVALCPVHALVCLSLVCRRWFADLVKGWWRNELQWRDVDSVSLSQHRVGWVCLQASL
jgi:hypothetical protein